MEGTLVGGYHIEKKKRKKRRRIKIVEKKKKTLRKHGKEKGSVRFNKKKDRTKLWEINYPKNSRKKNESRSKKGHSKVP